MSIKFGNIEELMCPNCNNGLLHQQGCEVFVRNEEDSEEGCHINVDLKIPEDQRWKDNGEPTITIDRSMVGNPSERRQGIAIRFKCEFCEPIYILHIIQHKGCTHIRWAKGSPARTGLNVE